jgi:hypothetical protein
LLIANSAERGKRQLSTFSTNFGRISANGFQHLDVCGIVAGQSRFLPEKGQRMQIKQQVNRTISSNKTGGFPSDEQVSERKPPHTT